MSRNDLARATAVLAAAVLQTVAGALGGSGALGEPVGDVARSYPNPLLPAGGAFMIWNLIYLAVLALAVWQLLPSQRGEPLHRRTGWWIAAVGVLNAVWVVLFSADQVAAAQIVIVLLLVALAAAWRNAAAEPASGRAARWLFWGPLTLYTGWVAVATVVGALTTAAAATGDGAGTVAAVIALGATAIVLIAVVAKAKGVTMFAAAAIWALAWIAASAETPVAVFASLSAALVAVALLVRLLQARGRADAVLG
ncbi:hypothetical protein GCM10009830_44230 [Glycomyces endophyticus]|uniref:Tryptophan-rich sensory protein n=1 Tax=Glycomyces endophyticus TaxID=480996 RepID=A0ABN2HQ42_9ACTN